MPDQPIPQGPAPLLNRAWPRRGWAAAPFFGQSVSGLMMETTVLIERQALAQNNIGGFKGQGAWATVYNGPCHAEQVESLGTPLAPGSTQQVLGTTAARHYELFGPMTDDPAAIPKRGDRATLSDGYVTHVLPIIHVEFNAGLTDHWEAWSDEFEA